MAHHLPSKKTILVVADDAEHLSTIESLLAPTILWEVVTAVGPLQIRDRLQCGPDAVLADIRREAAPGVSDSSVQAVRNAGYSGLIYAVSETPASPALFDAMLSGANDYIAPPRQQDVHDCISQLLRGTARAPGRRYTIADNTFLQSKGLTTAQRGLLAQFAEYGFPRVKEFARQMDVSETSLWKRLERIRSRLNMDSMSQIAHLLTALSFLDVVVKKSGEPLDAVSACDKRKRASAGSIGTEAD